MTEKTLTHEELCAIWEAAYIVEREKKMNKQTNDEWRRTCSTEEFAEFLTRVQTDEYEAPIDMAYINVWKSWLKEKHNG